MHLLTILRSYFRNFVTDTRGAAGVEFLTTLPLLIGAMVFTAEYGNALRTRMVLNTATADAARFLSRTPLQENQANPGQLLFYTDFVTEANQMLEARLGGTVNLQAEVIVVSSDNMNYTLREDPVLVQVETDVNLDVPLLGFINTTLNWASNYNSVNPETEAKLVETTIGMSSRVSSPWLGTSDVGAAEVDNLSRGLGL